MPAMDTTGAVPGNSPGRTVRRHPLAEPLRNALLTYDTVALRGLLSPNFRHWLNATRQEMDAEQFLTLLMAEKMVLRDPVFRLRRELTTDDGFVLLLELAGHLDSGESWEADVCLVTTADDHRVERIDEFLDVRALRPLVQAVTDVLTAARQA